MSWNIDELKCLLSNIKSLPDTPAVCSDINCLNDMISCLDRDWEFDYSASGCFDQGDEIIDFVNKNYNTLRAVLIDICDLKVIPKNLFVSRLTPIEFERNVRAFLNEYDSEMLKEYSDLRNKSRLCLINREFPNSKASGITFPISTIGSCYVGVRSSRSIGQSSTLIHEMGHVHQLNGVTNYDHINRVLGSVWGETFPMFLQQAYADFLVRNGYKRLGYSLEYQLLDSFLAFVTNYSDYFFNHNYINNRNISRLFSGFLSSYFLTEYRKNPSSAKEMVDTFNSMIGKVDDIEILKTFDAIEVFNAPKKLINDYYRAK